MNRGVLAIAVLLAVGLCCTGAVAAQPAAGPGASVGAADATAGVGAVLGADAAVGGQETVRQADDDATEGKSTNETDGNESATNGTDGFGGQVSSFMQATDSEADGAVDQGLWEARVARNGTPDDVAERTEQLRERLDEIRAEREALREARANGTISQLEYASRMARLTGELRSIASAANGTASVGERVGADTDDLEAIRDRARGASGSPVRGPPDGGSPAGAPDGAGPGDEAGPGNESEPGNGPGDAPGSGAGQGDGNGPGNAGGPDSGNASDPGSGNASSPPEALGAPASDGGAPPAAARRGSPRGV